MEKKMYDSLMQINNKYKSLLNKVNTNIVANIKEYTKTMKEMSGIKEIAITFEKYLELEKQIKGLKKILKNEKNNEIIALAKIELSELDPQILSWKKQLKILLLPKDENDNKNVILEIRGAVGGNEANIFAGNLFNIYQKWTIINNMEMTLIDSRRGESGGFSIIIFKIEGKKVFSKLKFESGVHRVQRIPTTETQGRVHTSTATVIVMPEADETVDIEIKDGDLRIDTYRSSGAGGQSVNTTDSAVRITHISTGITATSQDGKNQLSNKDLAMKTLKTRLYDLEIQKKQAKLGSYRKLAGSGDRSEKIRTYNYPQDRVTDHRILFSTSLKSVLDGKINPIINALLAMEQVEKLKKIGI